ncbi:TetR family transcriptional regulator [Lactiplantibacillus plantarum]|uniref:TetR/AcrR family transcriptional regulator C-terminal domain-containing protein n=1 Tax=Lactiplantibacillus plantarum TaxID=1590 RepID=UPI0007BB3359|nr:TetR/AcrR family transcriptional regulator C-terminal domain-containing protein [Lactiplantibacillus plantarum]AYE60066.1 TetR family transcriptional regulator [Lactiplantibacillus plantarum]KZU45720.1 Transcriptional regulator TetR family [Lactiplantibacillus plantarum]QBJ55129.1 TetR family transcriptional regulator [Lactiplantibacillus plantarum]RDG28208.1 TetR family transcriptional regulator [Lactiplantibacillus plantarum]
MALQELSKKAFANAFEQMLTTTPMDKIRVTHLAKAAGTTPQAFYYHFHDKYDLVAWIYLQDYATIVADDTRSFSAQQIMLMMLQFKKRKTFYQKAFTDKSQNAIEAYANQHNFLMAKNAVEFDQKSPLTRQQALAISYHQYGVMGLFKDWLFGRLEMDIQQLADFQYQRVPDFLKRAMRQYHPNF